MKYTYRVELRKSTNLHIKLNCKLRKYIYLILDAETMFRHLVQNPISTEKTILGAKPLRSKNRPSLVVFENVSSRQYALQVS